MYVVHLCSAELVLLEVLAYIANACAVTAQCDLGMK